MELEFEILWTGEYIKVISPKKYPYEVVYEPDTIAVLPIVNGLIGIRKELCPPYLVKDKTGEDLYYTLITGKIDEGETAFEACMRELHEEAGVDAIKYNVLFQKKAIPIFKSSVMRSSIFILDIKEYNQEEPVGDGTKYESMSKTIWVKPVTLEKIIDKENVDYLLISMVHILKNTPYGKYFLD